MTTANRPGSSGWRAVADQTHAECTDPGRPPHGVFPSERRCALRSAHPVVLRVASRPGVNGHVHIGNGGTGPPGPPGLEPLQFVEGRGGQVVPVPLVPWRTMQNAYDVSSDGYEKTTWEALGSVVLVDLVTILTTLHRASGNEAPTSAGVMVGGIRAPGSIALQAILLVSAFGVIATVSWVRPGSSRTSST